MVARTRMWGGAEVARGGHWRCGLTGLFLGFGGGAGRARAHEFDGGASAGDTFERVRSSAFERGVWGGRDGASARLESCTPIRAGRESACWTCAEGRGADVGADACARGVTECERQSAGGRWAERLGLFCFRVIL